MIYLDWFPSRNYLLNHPGWVSQWLKAQRVLSFTLMRRALGNPLIRGSSLKLLSFQSHPWKVASQRRRNGSRKVEPRNQVQPLWSFVKMFLFLLSSLYSFCDDLWECSYFLCPGALLWMLPSWKRSSKRNCNEPSWLLVMVIFYRTN